MKKFFLIIFLSLVLAGCETAENPRANNGAGEVLGQANIREEPGAAGADAKAGQEYYLVTRVIDGDTIDVGIDGQTERIRLIGIDTPETVDPRKPVQCFGQDS